jgi:hypothetical protein
MKTILISIFVIWNITNLFSQTASTIMIEETEYENTYFQVRKMKVIDSKSKVINPTVGGVIIQTYDRYLETTFKYPFDFTDAVSLGMVSQNIISTPLSKSVEIVIYSATDNSVVSRKLLSIEKTTFALFAPNNYLPQKIEKQIENGPLFVEMTFDNYDSEANLLSYTPRNGLKATMTYYGATDSGKKNLLKTMTNNLGHITSYDYIPLIGVSTITDPNSRKLTYVYDTFNRLSFIKDNNQKIVKSYQYNFKNQ